GRAGAADRPGGAAARVNASAVRGALVAALLDWAVCAPDKEQRGWLLEVVRQTGADDDPSAWRERVLSPAAWEDPQALAELARAAPLAAQPAPLLLALGERLRTTGGEAVPLLSRGQEEHPAGCGADLILGNAMLQWNPLEAAGYYRAALASRPGTAVGYCAVGDALRLQNALEEAIDYYKKALRLDPDYARAHSNLGLALQARGRLDEA